MTKKTKAKVAPTYKHKTREQWLIAGLRMLDKEFFGGRGYDLPPTRVSVGFPRASAMAIGQCWDKTVSADKTYEIFICPTQADPVRVLDILLHELIHAAVGIKEGHKGMFRKLALEFGLAGKMTATYAEEGSDLHQLLKVYSGRLGAYPHAPMRKEKRIPKDTGWTRYVSVNEPTYKVITNNAKVEEFGAPLDPWGDEMEPIKKE